MTPPRTVWFTVVTILFAWASTAIAGAALWPIYQDVRFVVLVGVATLAGTVVAVCGAIWRWHPAVVMAVGFIVFLLIGVPLAVPEQALSGVLPTVDGLVTLLSAVALGWKQLLTITLPVGSYQSLLVPALVLVLGSVIVGLSVSLRARRGELGAIPFVLLFLTGIVFGPTVVPWPVPLALGLLATLLLWLVWRRAVRRRAAIRLLVQQTPAAERPELESASDISAGARSVVAAGLILLLASGAAIAAAGALPPPGDRDVLRTAVEQPFDPRDHSSPLAGLRGYLREDRRDEVLLQVTGMPEGARLRVATLDSYDGVVYAVGSAQVDSSSGTFVRVPTTVDQSSVDGLAVQVDVVVDGYRGVWVPTVGALEQIDFRGTGAAGLRDSFFFNTTSDTAAVLSGLETGDAYRLRAVEPAPVTLEELAAEEPGSAAVPRLGELPDELALKLDEYVGSAQEPGARLVAAMEGLRDEGYISHGIDEGEPPSRSGHAADRISELLTSAPMIGDAEQYAVTAALMARQLGFPARVVFGFAPEGGADTRSVLGSDVTAWIEVHTARNGWVAVDPVPPLRPIPDEEEEEPEQVARPQSPVQPPPEDPDPREEQRTPDSTQDDQDVLDPFLGILFLVLRVLAALAVIVAVVLAPFLVIIGAKLRRRWLRRRAPTPVQRISGGWDEFHDAMLDRGFVPPVAATRSEIAVAAPLEQSRTLAAVADRAVFGPEEPSDADADRVWIAVGEMRANLDRGRTRRQRLRALVSLRSLGGTARRAQRPPRGPRGTAPGRTR